MRLLRREQSQQCQAHGRSRRSRHEHIHVSRTETASATIVIGAPLEIVWQTVANVDNLARHSPETFRIERSPNRGGDFVGARFTGHNRNDRHSWTTECVISAASAPTTFAFDVAPESDGTYATRWTYDLAPTETGTRLTETFSSPLLGDKPSDMNPDRYQILIEMMEATLRSIKNSIENEASTP